MKIEGLVFSIASLLLYGWVAMRLLRPLGPSWFERVRRALALREPAIVLDSARVLVLLAWMRNVPDVPLVMENLRRKIAWIEPVGVFRWVDVYSLPPSSLTVLVWSMRAALFFAVIGVGSRVALAAAGVLHAVLWSLAYSTVGSSVHNHVVFFVLIGLALSPEPFVPMRRYLSALRSGEPLRWVATYPAYVRWGAMASACAVYVQPGLEKVMHGGFAWFNGTTLAGHAMRKDQLSTALASMPLWTLSALAIAVVLWETFFGLVLFFPRWRWFGVLTGWGFHEFVRRGMGVTPFFFMEATLLVLVTPYEVVSFVAERARRRRDNIRAGEQTNAPEGAPAPVPRAAIALAALLAISWAPTFLRRGAYPIVGNAMFSGALQNGRIVPAKSHLVVKDEEGRERETSCQDALAIHSETFNELVFARYLSPFKPFKPFAETEDEYCERLLHEADRHPPTDTEIAYPPLRSLTLTMDLFVVPNPQYETRVVRTCRAPGAK